MPLFEPKVSIVIPVYNGSNYLREAVDSALAQSYGNVEIIVVNDGSRDAGATEAVARSYGDRIRYVGKENGGVATALNAGIAAMTGDYFSWLSHDDAYPPDKIERQVAFLAGRDDREVVVYGDYALMDADGRLYHTVRLPSRPSAAMPYHLFIEQPLHGCTLLVPKSAFDAVGLFPEHLRTTQDYDLWVRMAMRVPFVHQPEVLVHGRRHADQGSRTIPGHKEEVRRFFDRNYPLFSPDWMAKTFGPEGVAEACQGLLPPLARAGLYGRFLDVLHRAVTATRGQALPRRLSSAGRTAAKGLLALGQAAAVNLLPASAWSVRQQLGTLPARGKRLLAAARNLPWRSWPYKLMMRLGRRAPLQEHFSRIYRENLFGGRESRSGEGSSLTQTAKLRQTLPELFRELGVKSLLDAPCGDFHWMRHIDLGQISYLGIDIVPEIIEANRATFGDARRAFAHLNLVNDPLPAVDLIFCRDCLVHLSHADVRKALANFKRSGSTYLLATTFVGRVANEELRGCWRVLNLEKAPFGLPRPLRLISEDCTENDGRYADKSLGLWRLADLC